MCGAAHDEHPSRQQTRLRSRVCCSERMNVAQCLACNQHNQPGRAWFDQYSYAHGSTTARGRPAIDVSTSTCLLRAVQVPTSTSIDWYKRCTTRFRDDPAAAADDGGQPFPPPDPPTEGDFRVFGELCPVCCTHNTPAPICTPHLQVHTGVPPLRGPLLYSTRPNGTIGTRLGVARMPSMPIIFPQISKPRCKH